MGERGGRRPTPQQHTELPGALLDASAANRFAACIRAGGVVLFPSDTVYGLACDPLQPRALARLYALKGRPPTQPAAIMFFSPARALAALPELGPRTRTALQRLLPAPLTLLLPNPAFRFPLACDPARASRATAGEPLPTAPSVPPPALGLRVPLLPPPLSALETIAEPILQSSANLSGGPEAHRLADVAPSLRNGADLVLDGGPLPGVASTVLDLRVYERSGGWRVVRVGPLGEDELLPVLGQSAGAGHGCPAGPAP